MLFSLEGVGIQWYILPAALIGSLFFSNFFCRFFCPVGGALRWVQKMRKVVLDFSVNRS
ncbi:4Fe-4S binding protein [uncultured Lutibacter sp.]|uniref:4Fe-4S binding protein n=1 Tax=uncultured Lutibacter sp. TaxID=437739 RepID=UPI00261E0359|nr:4Fe-4S binding protein [uncultured Lutibacter sp.]